MEKMEYIVARTEKTGNKSDKESIHSGQFMVSHFEAEGQDDEDDLAVPITESIDIQATVPVQTYVPESTKNNNFKIASQQVAIETSLSKLFQCMSLAYRQKLTSPKWNRFRGIRLRWKDKIRLNNVIWRCWHLQFIRKENTLVCQFASPLDVDTHNKPEAIVLEGKYWKRKLAAVTAEYKKWRMFYRNNFLGHTSKDNAEMLERDVEAALLFDSNNGTLSNMNMMMDEDYMSFMSDTLFSSILTNQPFMFPDSREMAKAGLADLIQPSLEPLQPNLDDYMDTMDPFQEFINNKLPTVPEEHSQTIGWDYSDNITTHDELSVQVTAAEVSANNATSIETFHHQHQQTELSSQQGAGPIHQKTTALLSGTSTSGGAGGGGGVADIQQLVVQPSTNYNNTVQQNFSVISKITNNAKSVRGKMSPIATSSFYYDNNNKSLSNNKSNTIFQGLIINDNKIQVKAPPTVAPLLTRQNQQTNQQRNGTDQHLRNAQKTTILPQPTLASNSGFKFLPINANRANAKFTAGSPSPPHNSQQNQTPFLLQNIRQTSLSPTFRNTFSSVNSDNIDTGRRGGVKNRERGRSRSNTREPIKRPPPLISAISDPALITPQTNALLTQLLLTTPRSESALQAFSSNQLLVSSDISQQQHTRIKEEVNVVPLLSQQQSPSNTILTIESPKLVPVNSSDNLLLNTFSNSNSPTMDSSQCGLSPVSSSQGSVRESPVRDKRVVHIYAEQKRRYNIKNGFDMIHSLIPHLNQNPTAKLSKAAMLQKGADYIRQLRSERNQIREEMDSLKQHIETLNTSISNCQSMLPASRVSVSSRKKDNKLLDMFNEYVNSRTMENWKFWIFSLICRPLLNSFNNFVSSSSLENLYSSTILWIEHHCTLVDLRPVVMNSLRYLSTKTEILSEPEKLPDEVSQLVLNNI